jgi:ABC-2 type transport system ATP-binding protein
MLQREGSRLSLRIKNLSKSYGRVQALRDINLDIGPGITGLLGPNGAGKTTLLKVLLGLVKPDAGRVEILGYDCFSQSLEVRKRLGYLSEDQRFYEYMSGREYLEFVGRIKGLGRREAEKEAEDILRKVKLSEHKNKRIGEYSQGMKQRLGLAQALIRDPRILLLDEPTSNLDPVGRYDFLKIIRELNNSGRLILLSSHILGEVEQVCDSLVFLNEGRVVYHGTLSELKEKFPEKNLQEIFMEIVGGEGG